MQYSRNDYEFIRGNFRVKGDTIEIIPVNEEMAIRIEFFGDEIEALHSLFPLTGEIAQTISTISIFPASLYMAGPERMGKAIEGIEEELVWRVKELEQQGKLLEAQRLKMRTTFDLEMIKEIGFCSGIVCWTIFRRTSLPLSMNRMQPSHKSALCMKVTPAESARWLSTASVCHLL
jgi:excinuclease ABC subunit B